MSLGVIVFTRDPKVANAVRAACQTMGRPIAIAGDLAELDRALQAIEWSDLVIDREQPDAAAAAARVAHPTAERRVIGVIRDGAATVFPGAQLVVLAPVIGRVLLELATPRAVRVPLIERVLGASVLGGPLEDEIDTAEHEVAIAFGVARCIISERAEPMGAVQTEGATWDALGWSTTAQRCRTALGLDVTLVVPALQESGACDSYIAVPLDSPRCADGFIGLLATGARVFSADERATLRAIATRVGRELRWRAMQDRTAAELERNLSGPGLDPLLGIWNRPALDQIAHAYVSGARRYKQALTVLALRVVGLENVNTRHGMAMGDRLLRRIADSLKPALRGEDLVGRYSGTVLAVVLQDAGADEAQGVATRVRAMLAERSLETESGEPVPIATTIGITALREGEEASQLLTRTARATKNAPDNVVAVVSGPTTLAGRIPQPNDSPYIQLRTTLGGSYRLRHEISRGGMGVVYRADDLALERPVAIKMLRPELAENDELVKHLRREAALLARVHHPNLVQIYNFGQTEGECYFVMELVEGESLQGAIDRHREEDTQMVLVELLSMVDQIGSALDALHERGIVHRDVKPANFIRDPFTGRSVLVDVGIAHRYGELSKQAGTPGFMAPEVIQGLPASAKSDVYGLAASVFAIATLAPPWGEGEPIDIIMRQCNESPDRISTLRPDLEPIDDLVAEALSFDVDCRPESAGAFARSLSHALKTILPKNSGRSLGRGKIELSGGAVPRTRGVVFRAVSHAIGPREADRLRDAIGNGSPALADALAQCAPLAWAPSELLVELLALAPKHVSREPIKFAREIARATVRTSFRSFFPASPATLHPDRTLSAIRGIWSRYHTWGNVSAVPVSNRETVVQIIDSLRVREMCEWTCEVLETLVVLSGGRNATSVHETCELDGAKACTFRIMWDE